MKVFRSTAILLCLILLLGMIPALGADPADIQKLVDETAAYQLSTVSFESKLVNDLGIDSLSMLLLSLAAEHKFGMQFETTEKPFETVGEVCDYIMTASAK